MKKDEDDKKRKDKIYSALMDHLSTHCPKHVKEQLKTLDSNVVIDLFLKVTEFVQIRETLAVIRFTSRNQDDKNKVTPSVKDDEYDPEKLQELLDELAELG